MAIADGGELLVLALYARYQEMGDGFADGYIEMLSAGGSDWPHEIVKPLGIDLTDPLRHDVLLTTERQTMLDTFERAGYRTIGLYPAMSWEWPEESFYDFDHYLDSPSLEYRGPKFGLWWLPDQFSMAGIDELHPPGGVVGGAVDPQTGRQLLHGLPEGDGRVVEVALGVYGRDVGVDADAHGFPP